MSKKKENIIPDYKRIYLDIIIKKYPNRKEDFQVIFDKPSMSVLDILELNRQIFGIDNQQFNQKHRSYRKSDILKILDYQRKNELNNSQLALHFKLSRNTVASWKKLFLI
ncbi:transposase [Chryseobacterium sp. MYb7]|uniref:transposase n=1 Tax=Chryseobacterium sp. MYb7 TaxID=1827290 RepID=UPI000CFF8BA1|nr:transposase [Chryseobacterium sp. MYb7]PRB04553.1 transposase [Chryseobacterium sp. MYb7]